jgi:hypothetical protein
MINRACERSVPEAGDRADIQRRYQVVRQCVGVQAGGEGGRILAHPDSRFCCSTYWRTTEIRSSPREPAT